MLQRRAGGVQALVAAFEEPSHVGWNSGIGDSICCRVMLHIVQIQSIGEVQINDVTLRSQRTDSFLIRTYLEHDQSHESDFLQLNRGFLTDVNLSHPGEN
jgi:hypothetical protein